MRKRRTGWRFGVTYRRVETPMQQMIRRTRCAMRRGAVVIVNGRGLTRAELAHALRIIGPAPMEGSHPAERRLIAREVLTRIGWMR